MNRPDTVPIREPAATPADDTILPFQVRALELRGQVVRLGPSINEILTRHNYPAPVSKLVGQAVVLTALLGSTLKFEGRFILQTQTDGPVRMLVIDFRSGGKVRACARFDAAQVAAATADGKDDPGALLGRGHLAMTIDQGPEMSRYQGVVALDGGDLEAAAHEYFRRSEQIPTRVRLAVAEEFSPGSERRWRAGGILLQFLPIAPERARQADFDPGDAPPGTAPHVLAEDEAWSEGRALISTVEDLELIDPQLSSERLVYRLFHERGVRVFRYRPLRAECSCSRANVERMLRSFPQEDRDHMVQDGVISVTCEFCSAHYTFAPEEVTGGHAG
ncbi:MAG TPA: Hsp33 family molecular chaperone [Xanthobacteraceae bacterium]|nr:Hsp33 family molecular chaperone [Xanthobacteraceae bacterium]